MNIRTGTILTVIAGICAVIVLAVGGTGCESDRAEPLREAEIAINPDHATLTRNATMDFTASGWHDYSWSLSNDQIGTLSRTSGPSVRYTRTGGSGTNQVLTVRARLGGTNSTTISASAIIVHR